MAVNDSLAALSDQAFTFSIVGYSLAVVGYAGEYAFGRRSRFGRAESRVGQPAAAVPAAVSVGGPGPGDPLHSAPTAAPIDQRATRLGRLGLALTVVGALMQVASLAMRGIAAGRAPWGNMFEFASGACLVAVGAFLWLQWSAPRLRHLGLFVIVPVVVTLVYSGLELYTEAGPLVAALQSYWLVIHVAAAIVSCGIWFVAGVLAALYLVRHRFEAAGAEGVAPQAPIRVLGGKLPESEVLDRLSYRLTAFAFPIFTFAVIAGAIWAEAAWGRFWGWDPKETWALVAWLVYAGYLHARSTAGWKGPKAAWINLLGVFAMTFNFLIINLVVSGLHSYSGLT